MNRIAILITLTFLATFPAAAEMVRFLRVVDGRTIVVDRRGMQVAVNLAGVSVEPVDEDAARAYLAKLLTGSWLLVEGRDEAAEVYRSPDAFAVNAAMQQHGYSDDRGTRETYLGEADYPAKPTSTTRSPAPRKSRRTSRRSSATPRRG
jgi:hypothetical protein